MAALAGYHQGEERASTAPPGLAGPGGDCRYGEACQNSSKASDQSRVSTRLRAKPPMRFRSLGSSVRRRIASANSPASSGPGDKPIPTMLNKIAMDLQRRKR